MNVVCMQGFLIYLYAFDLCHGLKVLYECCMYACRFSYIFIRPACLWNGLKVPCEYCCMYSRFLIYIRVNVLTQIENRTVCNYMSMYGSMNIVVCMQGVLSTYASMFLHRLKIVQSVIIFPCMAI
jgi:hypothetical protein